MMAEFFLVLLVKNNKEALLVIIIITCSAGRKLFVVYVTSLRCLPRVET